MGIKFVIWLLTLFFIIIHANFMFKWIMQKHFRHLHFNTFPMVFWGPIWCLYTFSSKVLNIQDSYMNVTLTMGMHLGVIKFNFLHSFTFVKMSFIFEHHMPLLFTFNHELDVKVVTLLIYETWRNPSPKHTTKYTQQYAQTKLALKKNLQQ